MKRLFRIAACTAFLFLVYSAALFASSDRLAFKVQSPDERFQSFRYQYGPEAKGTWILLDGFSPSISLDAFNPVLDKLFIQQSQDGASWSDTYVYIYDPAAKRWSVSVAQQSELQRSIAAYASMLLTPDSLKHLYEASFCGRIEFKQETSFNPRLLLVLDLGAGGAASNNIWLNHFLILNAGVGLGYRFDVMNRLALVPSVTYGILANTGEVDFDGDGNAQEVWYFDQQIRASVSLEWMMTETMSMVIKPEAVVFFEANRIGLLYGIGAGLQFGW